jgi:hypothetical protein
MNLHSANFEADSQKSGAILSAFESKTTRITDESQFIETTFPRSHEQPSESCT